MTSFSPDDESSFGVLLDARIFFCVVIGKPHLPFEAFQKVEITIEDVLFTDISSYFGYSFDVDLEYPEPLHDQAKDFPRLHAKGNLEWRFPSDLQLDLLEKMEVETLNH